MDTQQWNGTYRQIAAQNAAIEEAKRTGKPVDDGYGTRWHPPGEDGIPIAELTR